MGGAAGVPPAKVVVIGLGVAGTMAARGARGLDAHVTGIDVDLQRLYEHHLDGTVDATQVSEPALVAAHVREADLVVGAALVPGARAPIVVTEEMVASMRPGAVVVDLAIDQGGCIETARPTTLSEPTYIAHGVLHYCVTNVPGQFPRTASAALSAAVAPRLLRAARRPRPPGADRRRQRPRRARSSTRRSPTTFPDLPRRLRRTGRADRWRRRRSSTPSPGRRRRFLTIVRGEGATVWDDEGRDYVDGMASLWYCNVGHGRAEIVDAVAAQMRELAAYHTFERFTNVPTERLCERLAATAHHRRTPGSS